MDVFILECRVATAIFLHLDSIVLPTLDQVQWSQFLPQKSAVCSHPYRRDKRYGSD